MLRMCDNGRKVIQRIAECIAVWHLCICTNTYWSYYNIYAHLIFVLEGNITCGTCQRCSEEEGEEEGKRKKQCCVRTTRRYLQIVDLKGNGRILFLLNMLYVAVFRICKSKHVSIHSLLYLFLVEDFFCAVVFFNQYNLKKKKAA